MNVLLAETIKNTPKFNDRIVEGVPVKELEGAEQYIESIFKIASEGWPPGLEFVRLVRCKPSEAYEILTGVSKKNKVTTGKKNYDLAHTSSYLVSYRLKWKGELLPPKYLSIPYVGQAGTLHLRGPMYTISPVLADPIVSVSKESVFIPFVRDRLTFYRLLGEYRCNGMANGHYIVWSKIHNYAAGQEKRSAPKTTLPHYLFCKFGLIGTFNHYIGDNIHVGYEEINQKTYPPDRYDIFTSLGKTPKAKRYALGYEPTRIRIAVLKEEVSGLAKSLIATFFYVADFFPDRLEPNNVDDVDLWKILLGSMLDYSDRNEGRLLLDVETHLRSLDRYVDKIVKEDLSRSKYPIYCDDIYGLFVEISNQISLFLINVDLANLYDKRLLVNRYVLLDFTKAIFNFTYRLTGNAKKEITAADINLACGKYLNHNIIFNLTKKHGEVNVVSSPGDCYLFKHTGKVVMQVDATSGRGGGKSTLDDPTSFLHASLGEFASYRDLPKRHPSGQTHMNPCLLLHSNLEFRRNPKLEKLIEGTQELVRRQ